MDDKKAQPFYMRMYPIHRKMLGELVDSYPLIQGRKKTGIMRERKLSNSHVVCLAIEALHTTRVKDRKYE